MNSQVFPEEVTRGLSDREWALSRIRAWASGAENRPAFLVHGPPGSGKSTLLVQYLSDLEADGQATAARKPRVIASILRHPSYQQPFDATHFLTDIVKELAAFDVMPDISELVAPIPQINVSQQNIGQADHVTGVVLQLGTSATSSLLALAEKRVRATPKTECALIVIDALDQAEDEAADEFLRAVAAIVRAADGTGVRILCTSRTRIPVWLDPTKRIELDLVEDAGDLNSELKLYLDYRFKDLAPSERDRVVDALLQGAQGNWLWAATNATALETEIAESNAVPHHINLAMGLGGLYSDGWRRIRQRVASRPAEARVKRILGAVACSFTGSLGLTELRWTTDIEPSEIKELVHDCEPFLVLDQASNVRAFHPDFSRWLFQAEDVGLSEPSEHFRLAAGLTRLGKTMRWRDAAGSYATHWVLNHWCSVLILDPFRPDAEKHEEELAAIIADQDWADHAGSSLEAIAQLGSVAPRLQLPGYEFPLSVGLRALQASSPAGVYLWYTILTRLSAAEVEEVLGLKEGRRRWLEEHLPDFSAVTAQALWGGLLAKRFHVSQEGSALVVALRPAAIRDAIESAVGGVGLQSQLASEMAMSVAPEEKPVLLTDLRAQLARKLDDWTIVAKVNRTIGAIFRAQANAHSGDELAEDLAQALAAYTAAWEVVPPEDADRVDFAVDLANTLLRLAKRSDDEVNLLISAQAEVRDRRRDANDTSWPIGANLLGRAYEERARRQGDQDARNDDFALALAAYIEAWEAVPPGHEYRLTFAIDLANMLRDTPARSAEQVELLITAQAEIRRRRRSMGDPGWPMSANLLGEAYEERAGTHGDDADARQQDLALALAAYSEAWRAVPPGHANRLDFAIGLANALRELPSRSAEQLDLLVAAQAEILDFRRSADDPAWPMSANRLGDAYDERARSRGDDEAAQQDDLVLAFDSYGEAWAAVPADDEHRLDFTIDVANTLLRLKRRSAAQVDVLIAVQSEVRDRRRAGEDPTWPVASNLLGDAYRERADLQPDAAAQTEDLERSVACYTEAWESVSPDHEFRLDLAIGLVNGLRDLPARSPEQLDMLVAVQSEVRDLRRAAEDATWPQSANRLGDAYQERAASRVERNGSGQQDAPAADQAEEEAVPEEEAAEDASLAAAADPAEQEPSATGDEAGPPSTETAGAPPDPQLEQELASPPAGDDQPPAEASAEPDAAAESAEPADAVAVAAAEADILLALAAYREAWEAVPADSENRLDFTIDMANLLLAMPSRTSEQVELLITAQAEIRDRRQAAGDPSWPVASNLLGDALREHARAQEDETVREEGLKLALTAYRDAWEAVPPGHPYHLTCAIDLANAIRELPERAPELLDLLIAAQTEIRDQRRASGDSGWPMSANLLGRAHQDRGKIRTDPAAQEEDAALALAAYTEAWRAVQAGSEDRLDFAIDLANLLLAVTARSGEQLDMLVVAQSEIRDQRRAAAGDDSWPQAANLLGEAYEERANAMPDQAGRDEGMARALAAYTEAWLGLPAGHNFALTFAISLANALLWLPTRSAEQLDLLITAQAEIRDRRRAADDASWPQAANLLGGAYRERAGIRTDAAAREEDLALALSTYSEAWEAVPPGHEYHLRLAVGLANALVVQAATKPGGATDGRAVIDRALEVVSAAIADREADNLTELRQLLPVLSVQLVRQRWSWI